MGISGLRFWFRDVCKIGRTFGWVHESKESNHPNKIIVHNRRQLCMYYVERP